MNILPIIDEKNVDFVRKLFRVFDHAIDHYVPIKILAVYSPDVRVSSLLVELFDFEIVSYKITSYRCYEKIRIFDLSKYLTNYLYSHGALLEGRGRKFCTHEFSNGKHEWLYRGDDVTASMIALHHNIALRKL